MTGRGWFGRRGQLEHYLRTVGADRDGEGRFIIRGVVSTFLGMDMGPSTEVVVPAEAQYFVNGQPQGLAVGLGRTSYGIRPIVI